MAANPHPVDFLSVKPQPSVDSSSVKPRPLFPDKNIASLPHPSLAPFSFEDPKIRVPLYASVHVAPSVFQRLAFAMHQPTSTLATFPPSKSTVIRLSPRLTTQRSP
ncbi:hypothetical protein BHM03_00033325 [Ensete ventricosum]|nr:hypothetical protein BHM03_00033325 [Ensete ventricosum]